MTHKKLALFGGSPLVEDHSSLKVKWPITGKDDFEAVVQAYDRADFSGRGSAEVRCLEQEMANYFNMPYGTALNSGTAALHAALYSLGIGDNDEIIVPNLTFIATAMAVVHNGSTPVFADIDPVSHNLTADTIAAKITNKTKAVIVVHMHGIPADMDPIRELCEKNHIFIIEDVAQAPGATYKGRLVGSFGHASVFSLMSQKNLGTCGECGILLSSKKHDKNRAEMLRIYGEILEEGKERQYNSYTLGWNYTLNPIQAAMARTQLSKFSTLTKSIRTAGILLINKLKPYKWITTPLENHNFNGVFHFFRIGLNSKYFNYNEQGRFRRAVQEALNAEGLNVRHYQNSPISKQPFFKKHTRHHELDTKSFTATEKVIRETFVLGAMGSSPAYLLCPGTIDLYIEGIKKVEENIGEIIDYADSIDYIDPWNEIPTTSDSFGSTYAVHTP